MLKVGSCAAEAYEPRQAREGAAVSRIFRVPQGCLIGVTGQGNAQEGRSRVGCTANIFIRGCDAQDRGNTPCLVFLFVKEKELPYKMQKLLRWEMDWKWG